MSDATTPPTLNADLKAIAQKHLFRTRRLEDGELVIRLGGRPRGVWPSDHAHAGLWSADLMYVYIPCTSPNRRGRIVSEFSPGFIDRSSDSELLLLAPLPLMLRLLESGPTWSRARKKRVLTPEQLEALTIRARKNLHSGRG